MTTKIPKELKAYQSARREGSKAVVLEAAAELFLNNGFLRTSITEIAKKAGVSPATIYKAFGTKEALFISMMEREIQSTQVPVEALVSTFTDARQAVRTIAFLYKAVMTETRVPLMARLIGSEGKHLPHLIEPFLDAQGRGPTQSNGEALMRALADKGLLRSDRNIAFAVYQFVGMLDEVLLLHPQATGKVIDDIDDYIEDCVDMFCARYANTSDS